MACPLLSEIVIHSYTDPRPDRSNISFKRTMPNTSSHRKLSTFTAAMSDSQDAGVSCTPNETRGDDEPASSDDSDRLIASTSASEWKTCSEEAAIRAEPRLIEYGSGNAALVLVLLCFLDSSQITTGVLYRGSTVQNRWSECGETEEATAYQAGLVHEVVALLSDNTELDLAFRNLLAASAIRTEPRTTGPPIYTVDDQVKIRVYENLPRIVRSFWRRQALILVSHGFPRRYLDSE